ncbi:hypothetical protein cyc_03971 [Cyclospora cayetanensis]|uniref:Myb-like domain-containing protein n=1 Tax=Cyclospora cayetanensis TaxID=88456 RepID=A0A1D3CUA8_9EIME|nr:hypothetical protein cyc_03971 [Cyclospora cayetanensis]
MICILWRQGGSVVGDDAFRRWPVEELSAEQPPQQLQQQCGMISPPKSTVPDRRFRYWTRKQESLLLDGVKRFGKGNWKEIQQEHAELRHFSNVQLKDKFRNLQRHLPSLVVSRCMSLLVLALSLSPSLRFPFADLLKSRADVLSRTVRVNE